MCQKSIKSLYQFSNKVRGYGTGIFIQSPFGVGCKSFGFAAAKQKSHAPLVKTMGDWDVTGCELHCI